MRDSRQRIGGAQALGTNLKEPVPSGSAAQLRSARTSGTSRAEACGQQEVLEAVTARPMAARGIGVPPKLPLLPNV
jgi:hypothetical protein